MLSSGDAKVVDRLISILIGIVVFIFVKEALEAWKDSSNGKGKKPDPSMENLFGTYVPNSDQSATVWEKTVAWLLQVSKQFGGNLAPLIAVSQEAATFNADSHQEPLPVTAYSPSSGPIIGDVAPFMPGYDEAKQGPVFADLSVFE
jgi:hypothetical protein